MKTLYLSAADAETPVLAAEIIKRGGLVAIPTETVYGLGANGLDERIKQLLIPNIYKLMSSNCMNLLEQIFSQVDADIDPMADLQEVDD